MSLPVFLPGACWCRPPPAGSRGREVKKGLQAEGPSRLILGREPQLGPRPVALRLSVDGSEGQVDAWAAVMVLLGHLVLGHTHKHATRLMFQ